jgi:hypothetical protein
MVSRRASRSKVPPQFFEALLLHFQIGSGVYGHKLFLDGMMQKLEPGTV